MGYGDPCVSGDPFQPTAMSPSLQGLIGESFLHLQMRLKDPFSLKAADMTKRTNKPRKPRDEESYDEASGTYGLWTPHDA